MKYEYWLAGIRNLSAEKKLRIRRMVGTARDVYYIEEKKLETMEFLSEKDRSKIKMAQKVVEIDKNYEFLIKNHIQMILCHQKEYPRKLLDIWDYPYALFLQGKLPAEERLSVAIVGARQCSGYGEQMALQFAQVLAEQGVQIISGMAKGVDGAGQRGALNGNGDTYAVLGSGTDVCYPKENKGLYVDIQKRGGILSEQLPGTPPLRENFPARNRIISGLSDLILVLEAKERSGSLITADMALAQGKDVYALPGPITSPLSRGCNKLIQQGAGILLSPEDLLKELELSGRLKTINNGQKSDKNKKILESTENIVYSCLGLFPKGTSSLLTETGLPPAQLMELLVSLELKGYIKEVSKNYYIRIESI